MLDTRKRALSREGSPIPLTPKAFDVLVVMLQNPHRVLTKEELIKAVWPDAVVEEGNLTQNVSVLRKALAEGSGHRRMIVTIARKGYQFTADVAEVEAPEVRPDVLAVVAAAAQPGPESRDLGAASETRLPAAPSSAIRFDTRVEAASQALPAEESEETDLSATTDKTERTETRGRRRWPRRAATVLLPLAALVAVAGVVRWRNVPDDPSRPAQRRDRIMLAVLPFRNLTGDPSQEYLADGLTEELISRLARLHPERLGVIARTSVMAYKATAKRLDEIGRELAVQYALESSVRRSHDRLRITVQLVRTTDQSHVWSEDYDRPVEDILDVQADVAKAVAREVQLRLTPQQQADLSQHRTIDPEVYEAFLRGRFLWNERTEQGFRSAIQQFQTAIAKAPRYAEAHAGLADAYLLLGGYGYEPQPAVMPKAKASARIAIALDGRLAEPYTTLGLIALQYEWNWVESNKNFMRALELNPNYAVAHHFYADGYLTMAGRTDEAIAELRKAHALDPRSPIIATDLGKHLVAGGLHAEGMALLREVLDMNPGFAKARYEMAKAHRMRGSLGEALAELDLTHLADQMHLVIAERGLIRALQGRRQEALRLVEQVHQLGRRMHVDPRLVAYIHFALGEDEAGFAALEKGYRDHAHEMVMLKSDPGFRTIRTHPRFVDLSRRLGLP